MVGRTNLFSDVSASSFVSASDNSPLPVKVKLAYPKSVEHDSEIVLDEFTLSNIIVNTTILRKMGSTGGTFRYMRPLKISFAAEDNDANYKQFRGVLVTFRFRRVPPQGASRDGPQPSP